MKAKTLSKWMKMGIVLIAICGLFIYLLVIPGLAGEMIDHYPEFTGWFWPWLGFIWITGIPCYTALGLGWRIARRISHDQSFTRENAKDLKKVSYLALIDSLFFFIGNIVLLLMGMNPLGMVLCSLMIVFAGIAVTLMSAVLSDLIGRAAALQEQSDLTI